MSHNQSTPINTCAALTRRKMIRDCLLTQQKKIIEEETIKCSLRITISDMLKESKELLLSYGYIEDFNGSFIFDTEQVFDDDSNEETNVNGETMDDTTY